jgi:hypothetical protein
METIGYFEEFIIDGKFIGCRNCTEQDRVIGYYGKTILVATEDIFLDNKKKIKKGQTYYTRYYPLNGRIIK